MGKPVWHELDDASILVVLCVAVCQHLALSLCGVCECGGCHIANACPPLGFIRHQVMQACGLEQN
jgi:hypothetical protein